MRFGPGPRAADRRRAEPPAAGQAAPAQGATAPPAKRPPQAKTQPEYDAYKAAAANTDAAALEKAADDFATKFPDSELRVLLYQTAMRLYQNANNAEKTEAMGRKVLGIDGDDPEALVIVAEVIAERTRDADIDKDQRFARSGLDGAEGARRPWTPTSSASRHAAGENRRLQVAAALATRIRSWERSSTRRRIMPAAQEDSAEVHRCVTPANPDPVVVLRLALALDKQAEVCGGAQGGKPRGGIDAGQHPDWNSARHERDRLQTTHRRRGPGANRRLRRSKNCRACRDDFASSEARRVTTKNPGVGFLGPA